MTLDTGMLLSLLTADPAERDAQVGKLLTQHLGADTGTNLDAILGAVGQAPPAVPVPEAGSPASALYREAQLLDDEVQRLGVLVADVAAALGACPRCLGTDESCSVCGGGGNAGSGEPDRELFAALIAPALVRVIDEEGALDTS